MQKRTKLNGIGQMTKMSAMLIYGHHFLNIFFSGTPKPISFGFVCFIWDEGPTDKVNLSLLYDNVRK